MEGEKLGAINVIAASFLWRSPEMQDERCRERCEDVEMRKEMGETVKASERGSLLRHGNFWW